MTDATRKKQMVPISADTVRAISVVLDYLWEDERKHHEYCQEAEACTSHVFNSLQRIRGWLDTVPMENRPKLLMK